MLSEGGLWPQDTVTLTYANRLRTGLSLASPAGSLWTQGYAYDAARRLTGITSPAGTFGYLYDPVRLQRVHVLALPNGAVITNAYDSVARLTLTALLSSEGSDLDSYGYAYNQAGQRTTVVRTAGDYATYTYDPVGELLTTRAVEAGGVTNRWPEQFNYAYDAAGNLNARTNFTLAQTFGVNSLNELTTLTNAGPLTVAGSTTIPATSVTVNTSNALEYADNTFASTNQPWVSGPNTYTAIAQDALGHHGTNSVTVTLQTTNGYIYDLNGNLLTDGTRAFAYDDENELISVWQTNVWRNDFVYDGKLRRRIEKDFTWTNSAWSQTNEIHFIYDGNLVIQERNPNNQPVVAYTRGNDLSGTLQGAGGIGGLLARSQDSLPPTRYYSAHAYYHADGNGNITMLINASQELAAKYLYDAFGNTVAQSGYLAAANTYRFSSKEWNANSGLYYYQYRFYDPNLQRWLNRDPLDEPAFETLHLVSQPLFVRELRLGINDSELQHFLAMTIQNGSINVADYLHNSHTSYTGKTISALAFFNLLRNGRGNYAPNWPAELLEHPNLYEYDDNEPLDGFDAFGLWHWYNPFSWPLWEDIWVGLENAWGEVGTALDAPECVLGMEQSYTNAPAKNRFLNDPFGTNAPPDSAGF
jgi:RHS repeat-associated protein